MNCLQINSNLMFYIDNNDINLILSKIIKYINIEIFFFFHKCKLQLYIYEIINKFKSIYPMIAIVSTF